MPQIDWNKLSLEELKDIQKQAAKAIESFTERQKKEARAAVEAKAKELGFSLEELLGGAKPRASKSSAKYCHPENPTMTWTGRGRKPNWVIAALDDGKSLDDLLIVKS